MSERGDPVRSSLAQKRLFQAVLRGKVNQLEHLLQDDDVDVNAPDADCRTCLMHSVVLEHQGVRATIVRSLLDAGADVNATDADGKTALMYAMSDQEPADIAQLLLGVPGTDPNSQDLDGNTALIHAVNSDNTRAIRLLLKWSSKSSNVDVNVTNKHGYSALLMAIKLHRAECCRVLVQEAGANPGDLSKHWQKALTRLLGGDSGGFTLRHRGRRSSASSLSSALEPWNAPGVPVGKNVRTQPHQTFVRIPSSTLTLQPRFSDKRPLSHIRKKSTDTLSLSTLENSLNSIDTSRKNDGSNPCKNSLSPLQHQPVPSREDSVSSLFSDSTLRDSRGRLLTAREGTDTSISTVDTIASRPDTRPGSDLSVQTVEAHYWGRSSRLKREGSNLSRRGSQPAILKDTKGAIFRRSGLRPSTSIILDPHVDWSTSRATESWLQSIPGYKKSSLSRTVSSLSCYQHSTARNTDKFLRPQGRTNKETALKHIRGQLRKPPTPTPSCTRLFSREEKLGRRLPAINSSNGDNHNPIT